MPSPRAFVLAGVSIVVTALWMPFLLAGNARVEGQPAACRPGAGLGAPPAALDFPRLGMWWPDPWEQPLQDIARYDWVILGGWAAEFIEPLRALNPRILLLNSTNACELCFNPDPDAEPWENAGVLAVPPEWFLTQAGSTLVEPVDAAATAFHVAQVAASEGGRTYDLFVAGDTVLIGGESALVEAVDPVSEVLTVRRGYVRPAAPHEAGTRVAAHITFWPGSWVLNTSTMCPAAVADPLVGPETWADYNARAAVDLVNSAPWDGILLDRSDPDESWLVGHSTARTIDPDQTNTLLADYGAFDQAWNAGLRRYESALRNAVGPDKIVFVNWGMANYDLLNGNNFEGFPMDDGTAYGTPWQRMVFGPAGNGSYFEWMEKALDPNLTMIETYEEDGGPDPHGGGHYDNPCDDPGFVPDYRKMRFGLATALLGDGFFSYEINTNGHGSLCLMWFDEYDNAGAGRGYLGQPLGPAFLAEPALATPDLLGGGTFEGSLGGWQLWTDEGYAAAVSLDSSEPAQGSASARLEITQSAGTDWQVSFYVRPVQVLAGTEYTLSFWARADAERSLSAWVQQGAPPWDVHLWFGALPLTTGWQHFELCATADGGDPVAGFHFGAGEAVGRVWLDDVRLQAGSRQVWRRDFEGGAVLLNASSSPRSVPLGGPFRRIRGSQAPDVNDGSLVTRADLPPLDGRVLLRHGGRAGWMPSVMLLLLDTGGPGVPPSP